MAKRIFILPIIILVFWGTFNAAAQETIYLPIIHGEMKEEEPNNSSDQANGPILSGIPYRGFHNDDSDYYIFNMELTGEIRINLTSNFTDAINNRRIQLQLYHPDVSSNNRVREDKSFPYDVSFLGNRGAYYVRVFTDPCCVDSNQAYQLNVSYQTPPTPSPTPIPGSTPTPRLTPMPTSFICASPRPQIIGFAELSGEATINTPEECTRQIQNGTTINTSGTYIGVSDSDDIWVLVWAENSPLYWPQAIAPCATDPIYTDWGGGLWLTQFSLGGGADGKPEKFDILVVVSDQAASQFFIDWFTQACNTGVFPGIPGTRLRQLNLVEKTFITVESLN